MSLALALALPLVGAAGPVQGCSPATAPYRELAWRTLIGQGGGTLAGVTGALLRAGAWALIAQQRSPPAPVPSCCSHSPIRPCRMFSIQRLRELLWIGLPLTVSTLLQHGR